MVEVLIIDVPFALASLLFVVRLCTDIYKIRKKIMKRQFVWYHSTVQKELRTRLRTKIRKADIYIDLYIYIYTYGGLIPKNRVVWLCRWSCFFFFLEYKVTQAVSESLQRGGGPRGQREGMRSRWRLCLARLLLLSSSWFSSGLWPCSSVLSGDS